jgi:hypothetical protein
MAVTLPRPCAFGFADRFKGGQATVATKHDIIRTGEEAAGLPAKIAVLHHRAETSDDFLQAASNLA